MLKLNRLIYLLLLWSVPSMGVDLAPAFKTKLCDPTEVNCLDVNASGQAKVLATQSGVWTTNRGWTLSNGTDSIAAVQSGTWNITNITGTVSLPTGAATAANQSTEITSLQLIDDTVHSMNGSFNKANAIGGQLDDTSTTAATEDNVAPARITAQRGLHVNLRNASGSEIGISGSPVRTDPTGTTTQPTSIKGGTDNTVIGNVGDRLKVDAAFTAPPTIAPAYDGDSTRISDMNVANGGVARGTSITSTTTYTTVFNYNGSGKLFSFLITLEGNLTGADPFNVKLEIDGITIFEITTLDIGTNTIYNLVTDGDENTMGMSVNTNVFRFASPRGGAITYNSNLKISIKKAAGGSKLFRAGMVYHTRET